MSELETKRKAIMNAVASGQLTNLLDGVSYTVGYYLDTRGMLVQDSGSIANKNIVTDFIEVEPDTLLLVHNLLTSSAQQRITLCMYNDSKSLVDSRQILVNNLTQIESYGSYYVANPNAKYIRLDFRSFGNSTTGLYGISNLSLNDIQYIE